MLPTSCVVLIYLFCCHVVLPSLVKCLRGPRMKVHLHIFAGATFDWHIGEGEKEGKKGKMFFSLLTRNLMVSLSFIFHPKCCNFAQISRLENKRKKAQYILYSDKPNRLLSCFGMKNAWQPNNELVAIDLNLQFFSTK